MGFLIIFFFTASAAAVPGVGAGLGYQICEKRSKYDSKHPQISAVFSPPATPGTPQKYFCWCIKQTPPPPSPLGGFSPLGWQLNLQIRLKTDPSVTNTGRVWIFQSRDVPIPAGHREQEIWEPYPTKFGAKNPETETAEGNNDTEKSRVSPTQLEMEKWNFHSGQGFGNRSLENGDGPGENEELGRWFLFFVLFLSEIFSLGIN